MIISEPRKVLFVHIQKTGGSTIHDILTEHLPGARDFLGTHDRARAAKRELGASYDSYYRFAFVRNPWDRLVSWYSMIVQKAPKLTPEQAANPDATHNRLWQYVLENSTCFEDFIRNCTGVIDDHDGRKSFAFNQVDYITDEDGRFIVDDVFRFESFSADCRKVLARLGIAVDIPRQNPSKHQHYSEYYTPETRDIIRKRFAPDIEYFGYQFGA